MPRILSVEDDPELQHLLSIALRHQGFEMHYAFTGTEGLEKALSLGPDLILLDMMLPGMNGAEVAERLRGHPSTRDVPIIVLTAYPGDANFLESRVRALAPADYLRKPVDLDELVSLIRRRLEGKGGAPPAVWSRGAIRIAAQSRSVWIGARLAAQLGPKRFELLFHLLQTDGEIPWEELVLRVWGARGNKNELEKTVSRLREDLGPDGYRLTTTRAGYRLVV